MTYSEAISYIHSVSWKGSRPGLSRITELLSLLGNPQKELRVVHVAGTDGKGSFCAMLDSVLRAAGYRTGMFTSPYIEFFGERMCICGEMIPNDVLADITDTVRPFADGMADSPTEFELITAIGFEYFRREKVDVAIVECGMGGRLDSTNVFDAPLLSVITGIALDHTQYLGDTVAKIAFEKAGIIRPGCPVLFGGNNPEAAEVIKRRASELGCAYTETDRTLISGLRMSPDGADFDFGGLKGVHLPLLGTYQPYNAANVITACGLLGKRGLTIPECCVRSGLASARWKGRFERMCADPEVYFDGGHNTEGVTAAIKTLNAYYPGVKANLLTGVLADKDYRDMVRIIAPYAERVFTVTPDNPRALGAGEYAGVFRSLGIRADSFDGYESAVAAAFADSKEKHIPLLALGSLYSYAPFKAALAKVTNN